MKFDIDSTKVCFLSPHSDDTFLELYFTIANRVLPGEYFLCTVFSESNYVDISQKDLFKNLETVIKSENELYEIVVNFDHDYIS